MWACLFQMLQPTTSANFIFRTALEIQVALEARLLGPGINAVIGAVILLVVIGFFQKTD
jgi:uncharacterized membrane protein YeaQ/YmgE (transglycosylase-associated protein family)